PIPPRPPRLPYTTLFRSGGSDDDLAAIVAADGGGFARKTDVARVIADRLGWEADMPAVVERFRAGILAHVRAYPGVPALLDGLRSEEHTSELQSRENLVC